MTDQHTSPWRWVAATGFVVMAVAQIAVPLADDDRALTTVVIAGFAVTTAALVARRWGAGRAGVALTVVAAGTLALERLGSTTGFPFGDYDYTGRLTPEVGGVPAIVPLAWFAMGVPALAVGRRLAGSVAMRRRATGVVAGAVALTAWDLFLDPQMVDEGYWRWAVDGFYRGIPLSNYAGWLASSLLVLAAVDRILPDRDEPALVWLYAWWAVMSTVGFVVFFGDALVGLVGGVVMVPLAVGALRARVVRRG